jgi:hypothetical protein
MRQRSCVKKIIIYRLLTNRGHASAEIVAESMARTFGLAKKPQLCCMIIAISCIRKSRGPISLNEHDSQMFWEITESLFRQLVASL